MKLRVHCALWDGIAIVDSADLGTGGSQGLPLLSSSLTGVLQPWIWLQHSFSMMHSVQASSFLYLHSICWRESASSSPAYNHSRPGPPAPAFPISTKESLSRQPALTIVLLSQTMHTGCGSMALNTVSWPTFSRDTFPVSARIFTPMAEIREPISSGRTHTLWTESIVQRSTGEGRGEIGGRERVCVSKWWESMHREKDDRHMHREREKRKGDRWK